MGAGRRALGPCHRNTSQCSVLHAEENKPPVSYQRAKTPLILLRETYYLAGSQLHATSAALILHQSETLTPTAVLAHRFPLPLALNRPAQAQLSLFPLTVHMGHWMVSSSHFLWFYAFQ